MNGQSLVMRRVGASSAYYVIETEYSVETFTSAGWRTRLPADDGDDAMRFLNRVFLYANVAKKLPHCRGPQSQRFLSFLYFYIAFNSVPLLGKRLFMGMYLNR